MRCFYCCDWGCDLADCKSLSMIDIGRVGVTVCSLRYVKECCVFFPGGCALMARNQGIKQVLRCCAGRTLFLINPYFRNTRRRRVAHVRNIVFTRITRKAVGIFRIFALGEKILWGCFSAFFSTQWGPCGVSNTPIFLPVCSVFSARDRLKSVGWLTSLPNCY